MIARWGVRWAAPLVAGLAALLLSACGGGGGGTDPVSSPDGVINADGRVVLDHGGFKLLYDCTLHSTVRYDYTLVADTGTLTRPASYTDDPMLPAGCQAQTSTGSYASVRAGYDRGHLVTSNHMDGRADWLAAANHMSNVVPQISTFNQGEWLDVENVAECYRDIAPVRVVGGVVYSDAANDYFLTSHGIPTPEVFWKVLITTDPATGATKTIAWWIPNQVMLNALDTYLVSIADVEQRVGTALVGLSDLPVNVRQQRASSTWVNPSGCKLG